jgi:hypothetical protein
MKENTFDKKTNCFTLEITLFPIKNSSRKPLFLLRILQEENST